MTNLNALSMSIPTPNPLPNSANVNFNYVVNPIIGTTVVGSNTSNTVTTQINIAIVNSSKQTNITNAMVGDTIVYTIGVNNSGNVTANNMIFIDTMPNGTLFVPNSVYINGINQSSLDPSPPDGINLGSLGLGEVATINFSVAATSIPTLNPTPNNAFIKFDYLVDPILGLTVAASTITNTVSVYISPNTLPTKNVSQSYGTLGDTLTYTLAWTNASNITQTNVVFVDTLPNGITFVSNSLTLNGAVLSGATITPPNGFVIGTVPVGQTDTVTFEVIVNTIPSPNPISNEMTTTYTYISNPALGTTVTKSRVSNIATTQINLATIPSLKKTVDKAIGTVGDTLNYTISFTNLGNVSAISVIFKDTIPKDTTLVPDSFAINGVTQPGVSPSPPTGANVGTVPAGTTTTLTFQVVVDTVPSPNPIPNVATITYAYVIDPVAGRDGSGNSYSNLVSTTINFANITNPTKGVNRLYADVGNTLTYTIILKNSGNTTATNIFLIDTIPNDTSLVPNSLMQDSTTLAGNPNPSNGVTLPNPIGPGVTSTVTFEVIVKTIPNPNPVPNIAIETYNFVIDNTTTPNRIGTGSGNTNIVATTVNHANLGDMKKFVDRRYVKCQDIITYTIVIPNVGNVTAQNIFFKDTIPTWTTFVPDSLTVNGEVQLNADPMIGLTLPDILPGVIETITFKVKVDC